VTTTERFANGAGVGLRRLIRLPCVKIIVVEDHLMFRDMIRKACTAKLGHEVIGETDSGVQAVDLILRLKPDAVILDLSLPDMDGFNVVDRVVKELPNLRILIVSSHCDDYTLFRVEKSRVHGFVDKNSNTVETLCEALVAVEEGRIYFSKTFKAAKLARRHNPISFTKVLSDRERAVLSLIGQGLNDEEIGERINVSFRTVQTHRSRILRKLDIKGTPKLIAFAIEHGFTRVQSKRGSHPVYS
jgi:two-component system response regulator NreC